MHAASHYATEGPVEPCVSDRPRGPHGRPAACPPNRARDIHFLPAWGVLKACGLPFGHFLFSEGTRRIPATSVLGARRRVLGVNERFRLADPIDAWRVDPTLVIL
jgi:hypothetical protein